MNRADLQAVVDDVVAVQPVRELETLEEVHATGGTLGHALRAAGAMEAEIELWLGDCARAAVRVGGHERNARLDYLVALASGMRFVIAVDHTTRKILIRPTSMSVH